MFAPQLALAKGLLPELAGAVRARAVLGDDQAVLVVDAQARQTDDHAVLRERRRDRSGVLIEHLPGVGVMVGAHRTRLNRPGIGGRARELLVDVPNLELRTELLPGTGHVARSLPVGGKRHPVAAVHRVRMEREALRLGEVARTHDRAGIRVGAAIGTGVGHRRGVAGELRIRARAASDNEEAESRNKGGENRGTHG